MDTHQWQLWAAEETPLQCLQTLARLLKSKLEPDVDYGIEPCLKLQWIGQQCIQAVSIDYGDQQLSSQIEFNVDLRVARVGP